MVDVRYWHLADISLCADMSAFDPKRTLAFIHFRLPVLCLTSDHVFRMLSSERGYKHDKALPTADLGLRVLSVPADRCKFGDRGPASVNFGLRGK
jgi:hypothetical protein